MRRSFIVVVVVVVVDRELKRGNGGRGGGSGGGSGGGGGGSSDIFVFIVAFVCISHHGDDGGALGEPGVDVGFRRPLRRRRRDRKHVDVGDDDGSGNVVPKEHVVNGFAAGKHDGRVRISMIREVTVNENYSVVCLCFPFVCVIFDSLRKVKV